MIRATLVAAAVTAAVPHDLPPALLPPVTVVGHCAQGRLVKVTIEAPKAGVYEIEIQPDPCAKGDRT